MHLFQVEDDEYLCSNLWFYLYFSLYLLFLSHIGLCLLTPFLLDKYKGWLFVILFLDLICYTFHWCHLDFSANKPFQSLFHLCYNHLKLLNIDYIMIILLVVCHWRFNTTGPLWWRFVVHWRTFLVLMLINGGTKYWDFFTNLRWDKWSLSWLPM